MNFDTVAKRYDFINGVVSFGLVNHWHRVFMRTIRKSVPFISDPNNPEAISLEHGRIPKILEVGAGTGHSTRYISRVLSRMPIKFKFEAIDISPLMLKKAKKRKYKSDVNFFKRDVLELNGNQNTYDLITASFSFRNFADTIKAILSLREVLRNGGYFAILDFSRAFRPILPIVNFYEEHLLWRIAKMLGGNPTDYQYLGSSIKNWYNVTSLAYVFETYNFRTITTKRLLFGVVSIHVFEYCGAENSFVTPKIELIENSFQQKPTSPIDWSKYE